MKKIFEKNELFFCILLIIVYVESFKDIAYIFETPFIHSANFKV